MGISKKIRKKRTRPPLSTLDKFIYFLIFVVSVATGVALSCLCGFVIPCKIALADKTVIVMSYNTFSVIYSFILTLLVVINICLPFGIWFEKKQPIFGNKLFKVSPSQPYEKVYPLFSKEYRNSISPKKRQALKKFIIIFCVIYLISAVVLPLSFFHRSLLHENNDCSSYNIFNRQTHRQNITEAEKMIIKADKNGSAKGGGTYYKILISFVFESAQYEFNSSWFQMETEETFKHLIELKNFFKDGRYEISGTMYIDNLIQSSSFSSEAKALVYELFDYNG